MIRLHVHTTKDIAETMDTCIYGDLCINRKLELEHTHIYIYIYIYIYILQTNINTHIYAHVPINFSSKTGMVQNM